jgi:hypothetical protein
MITITCYQGFKSKFVQHTVYLVIFITTLILHPSNSNAQENKLSVNSNSNSLASSGVIYRNPWVYNVDYKFELHPDSIKIDKSKDLKVWISVPREWASQKVVKIISIDPEPHERYEDPEYDNKILFWDFGKEPEKAAYKVNIKYRIETFEIHAEVDPENIGAYDKTSEEYILNTRSTPTLSLTSKIREMAKIAVGDESNPFLQANRIFNFVRKKMRFKLVRHERGSGVSSILDYPVVDPETGEEFYEGQCNHFSVLFVALCRAVGIPASLYQKINLSKSLIPYMEHLSISFLVNGPKVLHCRNLSWIEF